MVDKRKLSDKLINTYPDSIVVDEDGMLDYEATVYNFVWHVMNDIDEQHQKYYFGEVFKDEELCYHWLITELSDLCDKCYAFIYV